MEAGASPLLRGGRRYQAVPTADQQEDSSAHLSTEQQKKEMNKRKRVVMKGGMTNVSYKNISKKRRRYISDLFTTLLGRTFFEDQRWACVPGFAFPFSSRSWRFRRRNAKSKLRNAGTRDVKTFQERAPFIFLHGISPVIVVFKKGNAH